jgi:hypothetical protein
MRDLEVQGTKVKFLLFCFMVEEPKERFFPQNMHTSNKYGK